MKLTVENLQKKIPLNLPRIRNLTKKILEKENIENAVISVIFVSRQKMASLNKRFKGKSYATDVLAFDLSDEFFLGGKSSKIPHGLMGDIVISPEAAVKNSKEYDVSIDQELVLYVIHGILHLIGYDDHKELDIDKMRKRESFLLGFLSARSIKGVVK